MFFIKGFTGAAIMDLGETPRYNNVLTTFAIELIRTSRQSFTGHVGIGSTAQKALDDLFSNQRGDLEEQNNQWCQKMQINLKSVSAMTCRYGLLVERFL